MFQIKLKEAREQVKMSQFELSKVLGVAQSTVGNWEAGNREPDFNNLQQLAVTLNTTTDYLIGLSSDKNYANNDVRTIRKIFFARLKELRNEMDISQNEFALKIGVSQSTVGGWEAGNREPSLQMLSEISKFFNVSSDYLIGLTERKNNLFNSENPSEQKNEVKSFKDKHPELYFYSNDTMPDIPHVTSREQPPSRLLTGKKPKYFESASTKEREQETREHDEQKIRELNEQEMLQLFRKFSTRDQIKLITRLEIMQEEK